MSRRNVWRAAFVDRTYTLDEVAEAVRYVERGHARGKVLVAIDQGRSA